MALNLSIPVSTKSLPKDLEINPKRARAWVESLQLSNSIESGRMLADAVEAINRGKLSVEDRLDIVEAYRNVANALLEKLESIYAYAPLPLGERASDAFAVARKLLTEMAYTYKMFLCAKVEKRLAFSTRKSLPLPALRTMRLLRALMWQCYKTYRPIPPGVWQEVHTLLLLAEANDFAREIVDSDDDATIADLHVDMMMLSLADPYRLMRNEVDQVSALVAEHRGLVDMLESARGLDRQTHTRLFVIALDRDHAPSVLVSGARPPEGSVLRVVSPARLVERLMANQDSSPAEDTGTYRAHHRATQSLGDLGERLITLWGDPPKRQFRRSAAASEVALCAGIKAISHFTELIDPIATDTQAADLGEGQTLPVIDIPKDEISQEMGVAAWQVLNQSANGLRLHRESALGVGGSVGISVGEVVGVRFADRRNWNVGVVRWLTVLEGDALEFGVELLSPTATNVMIDSLNANTRRARSALLVTPLAQQSAKPDGDSFCILTSPDTYLDAREYEIKHEGAVRKVRATELLERTARFELFRCESV